MLLYVFKITNLSYRTEHRRHATVIYLSLIHILNLRQKVQHSAQPKAEHGVENENHHGAEQNHHQHHERVVDNLLFVRPDDLDVYKRQEYTYSRIWRAQSAASAQKKPQFSRKALPLSLIHI